MQGCADDCHALHCSCCHVGAPLHFWSSKDAWARCQERQPAEVRTFQPANTSTRNIIDSLKSHHRGAFAMFALSSVLVTLALLYLPGTACACVQARGDSARGPVQRCKRGTRCKFSHETTPFGQLLQHLLSARRSLDIAVFTITHNMIRDVLLELHRKGIRIRIVTDDLQVPFTFTFSR